jgi:hypothetical protein
MEEYFSPQSLRDTEVSHRIAPLSAGGLAHEVFFLKVFFKKTLAPNLHTRRPQRVFPPCALRLLAAGINSIQMKKT